MEENCAYESWPAVRYEKLNADRYGFHVPALHGSQSPNQQPTGHVHTTDSDSLDNWPGITAIM